MQGSYVGDLWGAPWRPTLSMTCRSNRACSHSLAVMPPIHPSHARGAMARLLQHAYAERPRRRSTWSANGCSCARTVRRSPGRMRSNLTRRGHSWRPGGDSWFSACRSAVDQYVPAAPSGDFESLRAERAHSVCGRTPQCNSRLASARYITARTGGHPHRGQTICEVRLLLMESHRHE
jgi:hypothetical protein